ncbi:MAG: preprotein translocase subunit SecE [Candidatus Buchananbacteria bacterium]|nr:preprotein translocase subunit SecE [Candidatus Buchananbacteria bacterium]
MNFNLVAYFKGVREEIRKVNWPNRAEIQRHTLLVIGISLAMAVFFWVIDYILNIILETII